MPRIPFRSVCCTVLGLVLALGACRDEPTQPASEAGPPVTLTLQASAGTNADLAVVTLEVTGPGIPVPIIANFPFENGVATGQIAVPAGAKRLFTARAYDNWGNLTHEGAVTEDVRPNNPLVRIPLRPLVIAVPIEIVLTAFSLELEPATAEVLAGETQQYTAIVRDGSGNVVPNPVLSFASANPAIATIADDGLATGHHVGTVQIAVSFPTGGISALATLYVRSPFADVEMTYETPEGRVGTVLLDIPEFGISDPTDPERPLIARAIVSVQDGTTLEEPLRLLIPAALAVGGSDAEGPLALVLTLAPGDAEVELGGERVRLRERELVVSRGAGGEKGRMLLAGIAEELAAPEPAWQQIAEMLNRLIRAIGGPEVFEPEEGDPLGLRRLSRILSADAPPRFVRLSDDLTVRLVGKGELRAGPPELPEIEDLLLGTEDPDEAPAEVAFEDELLRAFNSRTRNEFEVFLGARLLQTIHRMQEARGLTSATEGVDDPDRIEGRPPTAPSSLQDPQPQGWSNGIDTRIIRTPTTQWPWRTISQFTYGGNDSRCSGTLIGPRHVITAAHCINAQGTNTWFTVTVTPGRNGTGISPYGSSTASLTPAPGTEVWYFTPAAWRNPDTTHRQWDWGMLVIPNRLGDLTGWMGYVARPGSALKGASQYNRGYPSCDTDFEERPAGCQIARLYGDILLCNIGGFSFPASNGWNRLISIGCDISRGHSGSPVYHYFFDSALGQTVPVVSMVVVSHVCTTCGPLDFYPNRARRLLPGNLGTIGWLRSTFP